MNTSDRSFDGHLGLQRSRRVLLLLAALGLVVIVLISGYLVLDGLRSDRKLQALGTGVLAIMAFLLWLRVVRARWQLLQVQTFPAAASEETGIWGVGGPGMRNPGATGIYTALQGGARIDQPADRQSPR